MTFLLDAASEMICAIKFCLGSHEAVSCPEELLHIGLRSVSESCHQENCQPHLEKCSPEGNGNFIPLVPIKNFSSFNYGN